MRAVEPIAMGFATNPVDGARIAYEVFGDAGASRTLLFLPTWSIADSRCWKMQVPYFAGRGFRVVAFDGRGNGRSDRPASGYTTDHFARDTVAVLDAVGSGRAALIGWSAGSRWGMQVAAEYPERVTHLVMISPSAQLDGGARTNLDTFLAPPPNLEGWNKYNATYWQRDYHGFVEWFSGEVFSEPHSTKGVDDLAGYGLGTTPDTLIATIVESATPRIAEFAAAIRCPTLIVHGAEDRVRSVRNGLALHGAIAGSRLLVLDGCGHGPAGRDPVVVNLALHDFFGHDEPRERAWRRAATRPNYSLHNS